MGRSLVKAGICVLAFLGFCGMVVWENKEALLEKKIEISVEAEKQVITSWEEEGIHYVFLPSYAQKEEVRLTSYSGEFTVKQSDRLVEQGDTLGNLPENTEIPCISEHTGEEFLLYIMQSENLPTLFVETSSGTLDHIREDKEHEETGELTVVDETGDVKHSIGLSCVKGRGNTSFANYEKKPYSITTDGEVSLLDLGMGEDYALISNASEPTLIRNDVVRALEKALGIPYATRGEFVDLYVNQEYQGNYYLCADMEIGTDRIDITDGEQWMDVLYNSRSYEKTENYETKNRKAKLLEAEPGDITGGYLVERDFGERYRAEYEDMGSGFITEGKEHFVVASPKYCSVGQITYIGDCFERAEQAIFAEDGRNPETGKSYTEYIDVDSFAKKYLAEEISKNYDGGVSSSYFYKDSDKVDSRIYAAPGWDYDMSLGNYVEWMAYFSEDPRGISKLALHTYATSWFSALYEKEAFYDKVVQYYRELGAPFLEQFLEQGVQDYEKKLQASTEMNHVRWGKELEKNPYYVSREESYRQLKEYVTARKDFLDEVWLEGQQYETVITKENGAIVAIDYVKEGE